MSNTVVTLSTVVALLLVALVLAVLLRPRKGSETSPPSAGSTVSPQIPEGMVLVSEQTVDKLREDLAESQRMLGEERARHKAEMVAVQSEALNAMQEHRATLELEFAEKRRSEAKATAARSRTSLVAKIAEHLAPILPDFPYNFKECRWFGEIFDFLVFEGLEDGPDAEVNVVFVEVKTRRSGARVTNPREKQLKAAIEAGRVRYEIFVPDTNGAK
jgi:predicted Holliday junction resolvase-like endonuclease